MDGSTPSETAGTLYTGPISIGKATLLQAIAYASGMSDSSVASATYTFAPANIVVQSGGTQSTTAGAPFVTALQAKVTDYAGNPVSNSTVLFTAPASGAGGTFGGSSTITVQTNNSGIASAPTLTANATLGSFAVTASVSGVAATANFSLTNNPAPSIVLPNPVISGSGPWQNFSVTANDLNGANRILVLDMGFIPTTGGAAKCIVEYVPALVSFFLVDSGDTAGPLFAGTNGSIQNHSCVITQPTVSFSGTQGTINMLVTFKAGFAPNNDVIAFVADTDGVNSGWTGVGTWNVSFVNQAPTVTSISPSSGSGTNQTFTAIFNDPNGVGNISTAYVEIGPTLTGPHVCTVVYVTNWFALVTDDGQSFTAPVLTGTQGSTSNSQCTLTAPSVSNSGGQLTLTMPLTFASSYTGSMETWMFIQDVNQLNSGYKLKGFWTIP